MHGLPESIALDSSVAVKWFKKGEAGEQQALRVRDDVFTTKVHAIAPEWLFLEVVRALVKISYPRQKVEEAYSMLKEAAFLGLIEVVPTNTLLDKVKEAEIELGLFASDAISLATAIAQHTDLLTSDRHLFNDHVLEYAKEQGVRVLSLE